MKMLFIVYIITASVMSVTALILYAADKSLAIKGEGRIPERYLLGVAALGGAVGASVGRVLFHHKTRKVYFSFVIVISLCLQLLTAVCLFLLGGNV